MVWDEVGCNATREWSVQHGGLDYRRTIGQIILTAKSNLVVTGASVTREFKEIETPGDLAACPSGGALGTQYLYINLDDGSVQIFKEDSAGLRLKLSPFGFQLQPGESERIIFLAEAGRSGNSTFEGLIEWYLKLDALVDGKQQDLLLGNENGAPFSTVVGNFEEHNQYVYRSEDGAWVPLFG